MAVQGVTVSINGKQWTCSVMTAPYEIYQGLSNIPSIDAGMGMLFDLGAETIVTVNAYNMLFPIDVVFIDENLKVVAIERNLTKPNDVTPSVDFRYFLEVNAGEADGLETGDTVTFTGYSPQQRVGLNQIMEMVVTAMIVSMAMMMMVEAVE